VSISPASTYTEHVVKTMEIRFLMTVVVSETVLKAYLTSKTATKNFVD
jgi:transcriptional accessory protein Tex/SPT6